MREKPRHFHDFTNALETDLPTDGRTYGRTDGRTDLRTDRATYRDARTHLNMEDVKQVRWDNDASLAFFNGQTIF